MPDKIPTDYPKPPQDWFEVWHSHNNFFYDHPDEPTSNLEGSSQDPGAEEEWWDLSSKYTFNG